MQFGTAQSLLLGVEKQIAPESPAWNYQSIAKGYDASAGGGGQGLAFRRGRPSSTLSITAAC